MTSKIVEKETNLPPSLTCGIIMPISPIDNCSAEHWADVKTIIQESIESIKEPTFVARLVSDADDIGVIQKRIVQGIYSSDVVVCDVSAKNSNVMFELGMRLAFDKPTIIIKDDKTDYSFDTSIIEHIAYPRDLRFSRIIAFKKQLADKVLATHIAAQKNPDHSTFLKNFGTFKVAHLDQKEASGEQVILEMLSELQREMSQIRRQQTNRSRNSNLKRSDLQSVVSALIEISNKDPRAVIEPSDKIIDILLEDTSLDIVKNYPSKESFMEILVEACDIARIMLKRK